MIKRLKDLRIIWVRKKGINKELGKQIILWSQKIEGYLL